MGILRYFWVCFLLLCKAWKIPWTEEPGGLQSMGSQRVGHDWATSLSLFTFMHWRRKWQLTPVFFLENLRDGGAWWAAVYRVAQSWTRLKRLSSSSSKDLLRIFFYVYPDVHIDSWRMNIQFYNIFNQIKFINLSSFWLVLFCTLLNKLLLSLVQKK